MRTGKTQQLTKELKEQLDKGDTVLIAGSCIGFQEQLGEEYTSNPIHHKIPQIEIMDGLTGIIYTVEERNIFVGYTFKKNEQNS